MSEERLQYLEELERACRWLENWTYLVDTSDRNTEEYYKVFKKKWKAETRIFKILNRNTI